MKIAIPVNQKSIKSEVCKSFGTAPYYLIYDTETETSVFKDSNVVPNLEGAGIRAAQTLIDSGVRIIIAPNYGENAAKILIDSNIKVYKNIEGSAKDNIIAYKNNKLDFLADIHEGYHNHGDK